MLSVDKALTLTILTCAVVPHAPLLLMKYPTSN
jgi:hypothetical protein